jgi:Transposase DDE domain
MRPTLHGHACRHLATLRQQFLQEGRLPFTEVLSPDTVSEAMGEIKAPWKDRIFTPLVTLWVFLGQVLSADHSCRAAVARLIAHRASQGLRPCSSETGAYCQARKRLPLAFFAAVARRVGQALDARAEPRWLWKGRRVHLFDGSSVAMPDTPANRGEYPLTYNQKPGTGFAVARIGAVISLSCGAILDLGICRYAGKGQSESGLLRQLWGLFRPGDVLVTDRLLCAWTEMVMLKRRGIDTVARLTSHRTADFRRGARLGKDDHIVVWTKPRRPRTVDRQVYDALPDSLVVRECRVRVVQPGFRVRSLVIATTLLDAEEYSKDDLARLYRARWNVELDWRSIKDVLQMDVLRCKTPELVRKEIWTHVLAYNLIHTVMAQAASQSGISPRSISFKATLQLLEAFQPLIASQAHRGPRHREALYRQLLRAISAHRVADRPDRFEPRMAKRRSKNYDRLTKPRREIKLDMIKRFTQF